MKGPLVRWRKAVQLQGVGSSLLSRYSRPVRRPLVITLLVLAGLLALVSPAIPALLRYGTLPRKADRPLNVVLAGMDVDYDWTASTWPYPPKPLDFTTRTDTLMLAQVHPDGKVNLLSIPRDTWVNIPGYGWGKINGANVHGGADMLMNTVQQFTGVPIDGYVFMSLSAVRDLTNAAGGVTVDVPTRMKYDDNAGHLHIDLQPGRQHLNGEQAEGFLRFRHDSLSDIGRVGRQQMFMTALLGRVKNPLNAWRLPAMVGAMNRNTKSNLTRAQVGALLGAALSGPQVNAQTVPGTFGNGGTWIANRAELSTILQRDFRDPGDPRSMMVTISNVAAPNGSARRLKAKLEGLGYTNVSILDAARQNLPTTVITGASAARVQQNLGFGRVQPGTPGAGADVSIQLGADMPAD